MNSLSVSGGIAVFFP